MSDLDGGPDCETPPSLPEQSAHPIFQRPALYALPEIAPAAPLRGTNAGPVSRLLASGVLSAAALVGCGSSGNPNCPTPVPNQTQQQTCTTSDGTHYYYVPGHGWSTSGGRGVVGPGHPGSGT